MGVTVEGLVPADSFPSLGQGASSVCLGPCEMLTPQPEVFVGGLDTWPDHAALQIALLVPGSGNQPLHGSNSCTRHLSGSVCRVLLLGREVRGAGS